MVPMIPQKERNEKKIPELMTKAAMFSNKNLTLAILWWNSTNCMNLVLISNKMRSKNDSRARFWIISGNSRRIVFKTQNFANAKREFDFWESFNFSNLRDKKFVIEKIKRAYVLNLLEHRKISLRRSSKKDLN